MRVPSPKVSVSKNVVISSGPAGGNSGWRAGTRSGRSSHARSTTASTGRSSGRAAVAGRHVLVEVSTRCTEGGRWWPGRWGQSAGSGSADVEGGTARPPGSAMGTEAELLDGRVEREPDRVGRVSRVLRADTGAVGAPPQAVEGAADALAHHAPPTARFAPRWGQYADTTAGRPDSVRKTTTWPPRKVRSTRVPGPTSSAAATLNHPTGNGGRGSPPTPDGVPWTTTPGGVAAATTPRSPERSARRRRAAAGRRW